MLYRHGSGMCTLVKTLGYGGHHGGLFFFAKRYSNGHTKQQRSKVLSIEPPKVYKVHFADFKAATVWLRAAKIPRRLVIQIVDLNKLLYIRTSPIFSSAFHSFSIPLSSNFHTPCDYKPSQKQPPSQCLRLPPPPAPARARPCPLLPLP